MTTIPTVDPQEFKLVLNHAIKGVRFGTTDIFVIQQILNDFRGKQMARQAKTLAQFLTKKATMLIDSASTGGLPLINITSQYPKASAIDISVMMRPSLPEIAAAWQLDVALFPYDKQLFALVESSQEDWRDEFFKHTLVEDFSIPDINAAGAQTTEATARRAIWREIFADMGAHTATLVFNGVIPVLPETPDIVAEAANYLPTIEQRATDLAEQTLLKKEAIRLNKIMQAATPEVEQDIGVLLEAYRVSPTTKILIAKEASMVRQQLPALTFSDLQKPLSEVVTSSSSILLPTSGLLRG